MSEGRSADRPRRIPERQVTLALSEAPGAELSAPAGARAPAPPGVRRYGSRLERWADGMAHHLLELQKSDPDLFLLLTR